MLWIGLAVLWLVLIWWAPRVVSGPRGDFESGFAVWLIHAYCRVMHRARYHNVELIRSISGPAIIVANHTSAIDPLLIQAVCPREVRWMMGSDMAVERLGWLHLEPIWRWSGVIRVDRSGNDRSSVRKALEYLEQGGIVGIFPEGKIARPHGTLLPFMPGIGLIASRSGAQILCAVIAGTPGTEGVVAALQTRSQSSVRFVEIVKPDELKWRGSEIAAKLEAKFRAWLNVE
ncbi:MAG: 1-acyl-sn-glycerol-3-phosphate acyltransferase [Planctomycetes bacterium]|nr:1-acyl-sn-glycerol-3-phosphate acyltransferase [Planctomycetota bacterium]